jgi:hypothetical protein
MVNLGQMFGRDNITTNEKIVIWGELYNGQFTTSFV